MRLFCILAAGALGRDHGQWLLKLELSREVPEVPERLVRSRGDSLSPNTQKVLRSASALAPEFARALLAAVSEEDDWLGPALEELYSADLIEDLPDVAVPTYHFSFQQLTYRGSLRSERRRRRDRAARSPQSMSPGRLDEVAPALLRHFGARRGSETCCLLLRTGGRSRGMACASGEAISSYRSALTPPYLHGKVGFARSHDRWADRSPEAMSVGPPRPG
jgi:hypothetical protein